MVLKRTNINFEHGSYIEDRNYFIERAENAPLATGAIATHALERDKPSDTNSNLFIGYGWDVTVNSSANTISNLNALDGVELSEDEKSALRSYKAGDINGSALQSAWSGVSLTELQATALLNTVIPRWETAFNEAVGIHRVGESTERAALISLLYNLSGPTAAAIKSNIPTTIGYIQETPGTADGIIEQHLNVWDQIVYHTNSLSQSASILRGIQDRRLGEGETFGLYSVDGDSPSQSDNGNEAKRVVQFLDRHDTNNALDNYLIARKFSAVEAAAIVASQYEPGETELIRAFGAGRTIENVTVSAVAKSGILPLKGGNSEADLAFGEDLADKISGGASNDVLYGGKGNDVLDGGIGDDVGGFVGLRSEYDIAEAGAGKFTITHARGTREDGVDTLANIEYARFSDQIIPLGASRAGKDIVLSIDLSSSMGDDLSAVKSRSLEIVDAVLVEGEVNLENRIGIVTFNDLGSIQAPLPFTSDKQTALNSIQSLAILGGGAEPSNGALLFALQGGLGDWRENSTARKIVLFTDEAPADPELKDDVAALSRDINVQVERLAQSLSDATVSLISIDTERLAAGVGRIYHSDVELSVASAASAVAAVLAVDIYTVVVGTDASAIAAGQETAAANRGLAFTAANASEVVNAILDAIGGNPNSPTPGNDVLNGTTGPDFIDALAGNDTVNGLAGNDQLTGNTGNDQLNGGEGDDRLIGSLGNDALNGGTGTDEGSWFQDGGSSGIVVDVAAGTVLRGTERDTLAGIERVVGTEFTDTMNGDSLANDLRGNGGNDNINGLGGVDNLLGEGGNDTIHGNEGNDLVYGGPDDDRLFGDAGADRIGAGYGIDVIFGGTGNDTFDINSLDSGIGRGTRDIIADFATGDKIDIISIDAKLSVSGDQAFSFIGGNAFSAAGQLRFFRDGSVTVIEGTNDADNAPEFQLEISRVFSPVAADFLL